MNFMAFFLKKLIIFVRKFGKVHFAAGVLDQDRVSPGPNLSVVRQTKEQTQEDNYDKDLIKNIDRVMPFLSKNAAILDSEKGEE